MTVWLANYNEPTDPTAYERQLGEIVTTINAYGTDNIGGVTVGNEWMLKFVHSPYNSRCQLYLMSCPAAILMTMVAGMILMDLLDKSASVE